jgi:general secretion pathway protein H
MRSARGFSLIEMLVVLLVIVLMTSLVTLNLDSGAGDRELRERVETLIAVAGYAIDEAQFSGSDFGVLFVAGTDDRGDPVVTLHWRQRLLEGWRAPRESREIFRPLRFPTSARVQLLIDGDEALLADPAAADPGSGAAPQWLLVASGETQPGEVIVRNRDDDSVAWRVSWDALARFDHYRGEEHGVA